MQMLYYSLLTLVLKQNTSRVLGSDIRDKSYKEDGYIQQDLSSEDLLLRGRNGSRRVINYKCGESFFLPDKRLLAFQPKATTKDCGLKFFGSRAEKCRTTIHCKGIGSSKMSFDPKCQSSYFRLYDGLGGVQINCGNEISYKNVFTGSEFGHDVYVIFKGMKEKGYCEVFCLADKSNHKSVKKFRVKGLKKDSKLKRKTEQCKCGVRGSKDKEGRIVGGMNAIPFEFPWMAEFIFNKKADIPEYKSKITDRVPLCGGALITDRHILTAGHCFPVGYDTKKIQVLLHAHLMDLYMMEILSPEELKKILKEIPGGNEKPANDKDERTIRFDVEKIKRHPLYHPHEIYDGLFVDFDVAVVTLKGKVDLRANNSVRPICLYPGSESQSGLTYKSGELLEVAGWGNIKEGGYGSRFLQKMKVPTISWEKCRSVFKELHHRELCAGYKEGKVDACQGDSGSAAFKVLKGNQYQHVGIVSSGLGCASELPALYTNTFEVLEWIYHQTRTGISCRS